MNLEFWPVAQTSSTLLPMTPAEISGYLLADWLPSVPAPLGTSFMGWPQFLLELTSFKGTNVLALRAEAGGRERQWKSVMSWMLGVAATRRVLDYEGYRWVAPVSAFYENAVQSVDLSGWNPSFPRSSVVIQRRADSTTRLLPDYLAMRPTSSAYESRWALVEAKGTQTCLTKLLTCPASWAAQVRSAAVFADGTEIISPRHLVVATRVNPNAQNPTTRRLQVRAWNRSVQESIALRPDAAVEIAAAHLFGLFRGVNLPLNARAIALSVQVRRESRSKLLAGLHAGQTERASREAEMEITERTRHQKDNMEGVPLGSFDLDLGFASISLSDPLVAFARELSQADTPEAAAETLHQSDLELDRWTAARRQSEAKDRETVILPFGVEVRARHMLEFEV